MIKFITTHNKKFFFDTLYIARKLFGLTIRFCSLGGLRDLIVEVIYDHYIVPFKKHAYFSVDEIS
jgi:hypothetical protein